jgi:hypothetical protein
MTALLLALAPIVLLSIIGILLDNDTTTGEF